MPLFAPGDQLPPHQPACFGCGPHNRAGLHLRASLTAEGVTASVHLGEQHEGGPGLAHGGIVAAVLDDVLGFLLYHVGAPMVTRRLEVDFLRPVPLGADLSCHGRVTEQSGRKVWAHGTLEDGTGQCLAEARGLFVKVPISHFANASPAAHERLASWQGAGPDAGPGPVSP